MFTFVSFLEIEGNQMSKSMIFLMFNSQVNTPQYRQ
jgi:hypothetical protein